METIAITKNNTAIVELTSIEVEAIETLMNAVEVYARACIGSNVRDYSEPDFERYYERSIKPSASRFWIEFYNLEKTLTGMA